MNWFLVHIALPMGVPVLFMVLARLANLPTSVASRARLMLTVQNGQLGWVAMAFAGSSSYDMTDRMLSHQANLPSWSGLFLGSSCSILAISGFLAALGTLYPVGTQRADGLLASMIHFRLFIMTAVLALLAGLQLAFIHLALPRACKIGGVP